MKKAGKMIAACMGIAVILLILLSWISNRQPDHETADSGKEPMVRVWLHEEDKVVKYSLEEAVIHVIAAEMPASFPEEALKAQAVVARTYIMRRLPAPWGSVERHKAEKADICDDFQHCQAFLQDDELKNHWGNASEKWLARIEQAVEGTRGQVLTWQGQLVDPVYHSTCGGHTESAAGCWQHDVPVLQSVDCPWDTESPRYLSCEVFSFEQLMEKLQVSREELMQLSIKGRTEGNRVSQVIAGEKSWSGTDFRSILGLNSANFSFVRMDENWLFTVQGYGHGVGMCQYGAKGMAEAGYDFQNILQYYYQNVTLVKKY